MATSKTVLDTNNISDGSILRIDIAKLSATLMMVNSFSDVKVGNTTLLDTLAEISSQLSGAGYTRGEIASGTMTLYGKEGEAELTVDVSPNTLGVMALGEQYIPTETAALILNNLGLTGHGYMIINPNYGVKVDGNGKLIADSQDGNLVLSGFSDVDDNLFKQKYESNADVKNVDMSQLTSMSGKEAFYRAFLGCNSLKSANLSAIKNIRGQGAFYLAFAHTPLTSVNMSELTAIDGENCMLCTFYNTPLDKVEFPKLQYINGNYAMQDMIHKCNASAIVFPELTSIAGRQAVRGFIYDNANLQRIDFPKLEKIDIYSTRYMLGNNPKLTFVNMSALTAIYKGLTGNNEDSGYQFTSDSNLISVDFSSLKDVRDWGLHYAFNGNTNLQKAYYPNLTYAGYYAFSYAYQNAGISSVYFPILSSVNGSYSFYRAFLNTANLQEANFPELTYIYNDAFNYAFYNSSIKYAHFPKLATICNSGCYYMFLNSLLISVDFSRISSVSNYGMNCAFDGCSKLLNVKFSEFPITESYSFDNAFRNCTSLSSFDFPVTYSTGGLNMFYMFTGCTNLTSVTYSKMQYMSWRSMLYTFNACTKLETVDFPELTAIYQEESLLHAFDGCTSLKNVNFPKLQYIGNSNNDTYQYRQFAYAFNSCASNIVLRFPSLALIKLTLNSTDYATFAYCNKVKAMYFKSLTSIVGNTNLPSDASAKYLFTGCSTLTDLYFNVAVKDYIEAHPGYPSLWGRGAGNATVHFLEDDDPAWEE